MFAVDAEDSLTSTDDSALEKEAKGLLTTGATKKKKIKKRVSWKEESALQEIFYFELDEEERGMHDKTNKMTCAPSKDSNQPGHPPSLCCKSEEGLGP